MKKITLISILVILFNSFTAAAYRQPAASLTVFAEDGANFYLLLNGERYNARPSANLYIDNLTNTAYDCTIVFQDRHIPAITIKALPVTDTRNIMQNVTYHIVKDRRGYKLMYYSSAPAMQNQPQYGTPGNHPYYNNGYGSDRQHNRHNNSYYYHEYNRAMSSAEFDEAKNAVANNHFDSSRLLMAKQIVTANLMNAAQIAQIMELFAFNSSKLEFAKYAFDYCVDTQNYYKVVNRLTFSSSKDELNRYIMQHNNV